MPDLLLANQTGAPWLGFGLKKRERGLERLVLPRTKMRILFLTHNFPPEVCPAASRTYEHTKEWVKDEDTEITVITNNPNHPEGVLYKGYENRWYQREQMDGIEVIRVKTYLTPNKGFFKRTLNYLFYMLMAMAASLKIGKKDIVIATSPPFFCACGGYLVSLLKRIPFVFELRDIWPESIVAVGAMGKNAIIRFLEKVELFLYKSSNLIISLTDSFKENLISRGIAASKIIVIKNGVELDNFKKEKINKEAFKKEIGVGEKMIASYVGTIGMAHALDKVLDCAKTLEIMEDIQFLIVGSGAKKDELEEKKRKENIQNVTFIGQVNKEEVKKYYAISDIGLVVLRKNSLFKSVIPSKIFEYMAMEVPIIISVDGEARDIIKGSKGGIYVEPENVEQMTKAIRNLIQEPKTAAKMGKQARVYVENNFDRKKLARNCLDALKSFISTRIE